MSELYRDHNGKVAQLLIIDLPNVQTVSVSGASAATAVAVPNACTLVMLWCSVDAYFNVGSNPTAAKDATSIPLTAKTYVYVPLSPNSGAKFAFIQDSSSGTAWIIPGK